MPAVAIEGMGSGICRRAGRELRVARLLEGEGKACWEQMGSPRLGDSFKSNLLEEVLISRETQHLPRGSGANMTGFESQGLHLLCEPLALTFLGLFPHPNAFECDCCKVEMRVLWGQHPVQGSYSDHLIFLHSLFFQLSLLCATLASRPSI